MSDASSGAVGWLIGSVIVAVLSANAAWLGEYGPDWARTRGRLVAFWRGPEGPAGEWLLVAFYLLLPPFAAWRVGAVSPYLMGLTETDWPSVLGVPGLLAAAISALALAGWLVFRRGLRPSLARQAVAGPASVSSGRASRNEGLQRWLAPVDGALHQWHMAFYRAGVIAWVAAGVTLPAWLPGEGSLAGQAANRLVQIWQKQPVYWGSWLALVPIACEAALNPYARRAIQTPGRMEGAMRSIGLAVATTALFSLTRNFWLCLFSAIAVEILIAKWFPLEE